MRANSAVRELLERSHANAPIAAGVCPGPPRSRHGCRASLARRRDPDGSGRRLSARAERAALDGVDWNRRVDVHRLPSFSYASSGGCGNVVLYGMTGDRAETISVRASRSELQLSTTARTLDIARHPTTIAVNVNVYGQPMRHAEDCDDVRVSPGPASRARSSCLAL